MKLTKNIVLEIGCHEAIIRQAYKDSEDVWTWSAGITSASGHSVERYIDAPQPMARCLEVWIWLMRQKYLPDVEKAFAGHPLSEAQTAAALSFHWNTGAITRASWVAAFKAGDARDAERRFLLWNKPASIIDRRKAEVALFFDGRWSNDGTTTEYTRLTKNYRPIWSSAVKRDICKDLAGLL